MFEEERRYLDLQMFGEGDYDDTEDDDPNIDTADDKELDDEDEDEEEDFGSLSQDDELDEDQEDELDEETEDPPAKKPAKKPKEEPKPAEKPVVPEEKSFTKAEVEAMFRDRNARDPYHIVGKQLEQKTGMTLQQLDEYAARQREDEEVNKLVEDDYMTEEAARAQIRREQENRQLKQEVPQMRQELQQYQGMVGYINDKARDLSNPYVRKYEKEIDAFSSNGKLCSFESAKNYILGQKVLSGELTEAIKSGAINKTLADIKKQNKVKVQGGSQSGKSFSEMAAEETDPFQRQLAASMGVSYKELVSEKAKILKERKTGRL